MSAPRPRWQEILFSRKMVICMLLGFSSGMPLFVGTHLVPAWLRSNEVDLATIGLFAILGLPYTWKFLWSPVMDRYRPPFLGRRRGWMLVTQIALFVTIALIGTVFGALFGGIPADRLGRKQTLIWVAALYLLSALGSALAPEWYSFLFFRFLGGLGVGASSIRISWLLYHLAIFIVSSI